MNWPKNISIKDMDTYKNEWALAGYGVNDYSLSDDIRAVDVAETWGPGGYQLLVRYHTAGWDWVKVMDFSK